MVSFCLLLKRIKVDSIGIFFLFFIFCVKINTLMFFINLILFNEMRFLLYQCICKYWPTASQLKHLLDFIGIETVDFDTTLSYRNNLSNLSFLTCRVFGDIHITYKEIFYANVEMKLLSLSEIISNY